MPDPEKQSPPPTDQAEMAELEEAEAAGRRAQAELDAMPDEGWPIRRLIPLIKATIGPVGKNRRMEEGAQKYLYRSMDDILNAAHLGLVNAGVFPVPMETDLTYTDFLTAREKKGVRILGSITYVLQGPVDELGPIKVAVEANDYADKGTAKAYTVGLKTLIGQVFTIPFAMPDQDDDSPEREADRPAQRQGSGGGNRQGSGNRPAQGRRDDRAGAAQRVTDGQRAQLRKAAERLSAEGQALLKAFREAEGISTEPDRFLVPGWRKVMQKAGELEREGYKAKPGEESRADTAQRQDGAEEAAGRPAGPSAGPQLPGGQGDRYAEEPEAGGGPDAELRDHLTDRVEEMPEDYAVIFATMLDEAEGNPLAGADWRTQLAQMPPEWDEWLVEAVQLVETKHAEDNPPSYDDDPEGRPYD
jgi:hypothetical protein